MRYFITIAIVLTLALTACGKEENHDHSQDEDGVVDKMLARLDTDGDKLVSQTEFEAHFADIDSDTSGSISKAEMTAHHTQMHGEAHEETTHFSNLDTDNNGQISPAEFSVVFANIDKDGNGQLMRGELLQHIHPTH